MDANSEYLRDKVWTHGVGKDDLLPLFDPQTSGGLLVVVPHERSAAFVHALKKHGTQAAMVGEVVEGSRGAVK